MGQYPVFVPFKTPLYTFFEVKSHNPVLQIYVSIKNEATYFERYFSYSAFISQVLSFYLSFYHLINL